MVTSYGSHGEMYRADFHLVMNDKVHQISNAMELLLDYFVWSLSKTSSHVHDPFTSSGEVVAWKSAIFCLVYVIQ